MNARLLTPEDASAYVALRREALLDAPWAFGASPGTDKGSDAEHMRRSLGSPGFAVAGAFESGRLIAAAGLIRDDQPKRAHVTTVWGVYTTPGSRRRGLGRAVVALAIQTARSWAGVAQVQLSVNENSPAALALYESLGFRRWGTEPDCLRVNGRSYAEVHLSLHFDGPN
ncbi:MAG TPA: GNAT family N-acetyltransferase [Phycisphaerales bacterium]|nr:GNAT family N-acetyltransferase [Phycisphaerales bacterium]